MKKRPLYQQSIRQFWGNFFINRPYGSGVVRERVFKRYCQFVSDEAARAAALIQEPLKITKNTEAIKHLFGKDVCFCIKTLNRINLEDRAILSKPEKYRDMIILQLVILEVLYFKKSKLIASDIKPIKKKIPYVNEILKVCGARKLINKLEDSFFNVMHPTLFIYYTKLFKASRNRYRHIEEKAKEELRTYLKQANILAMVESRTKSIFSLHEKIKKKNILPCQIMDLIGLRVLVDKKEDCYRALEVILTKWSTQHSRVKDYIAIPKDNGYQSLHISGNYEKYEVEIQIRSYNMHHQAQYGKAAHRLYKAEKSQ